MSTLALGSNSRLQLEDYLSTYILSRLGTGDRYLISFVNFGLFIEEEVFSLDNLCTLLNLTERGSSTPLSRLENKLLLQQLDLEELVRVRNKVLFLSLSDFPSFEVELQILKVGQGLTALSPRETRRKGVKAGLTRILGIAILILFGYIFALGFASFLFSCSNWLAGLV